MPTYLTLWKWTEQGTKTAQDTLNRYHALREAAQQQGCTVVTFGWTQGPYDGYFVTETPDEFTATALLLKLVGQGNVTTTTLRSFDEQEMQQILQKLG
jgi:uncharacterized protein with GYD domain